MRLTDADALKLSIPETRVDVFENCRNCTLLSKEQVLELIDAAPTIEVNRPTLSQFRRMAVQLGYEKVVYCKYCKHRDPESKRCDCGCWHTPFITRDNDFCPYGDMLTNTNRESVEPDTSYSLVEKLKHSII